MLTWINILHFYQPNIVGDQTVHNIAQTSYKPWVDLLKQHPSLKVTININACLTNRLAFLGYNDLLKNFSKLLAKKQIEFLESAAFHPILPLLPQKEIIKQITINHQINSQYFGKNYKPTGFFLPEMAYSKKIATIINSLGYKYIILDQIALNNNLKQPIDQTIKYKIKNLKLNVVFRNRQLSQTFVPKTITNIINNKPEKQYLITATDGELYGHRYRDWWQPYSQLINNPKLKTLTASDYLKKIKTTKIVSPISSSWESTQKELTQKIPYALWHHPKNKIHNKLWQLAIFALKLNCQHQKDINHFASRLHLESGLASCTFWWASQKDFKLFSPVAWDPNMVERGALELLNSVRSLEKINKQDKLTAEKMFTQIRHLIWQKHWRKL